MSDLTLPACGGGRVALSLSSLTASLTLSSDDEIVYMSQVSIYESGECIYESGEYIWVG